MDADELCVGAEKPGFYDDIRLEVKILEKTRFLRLCVGGEKPGFCDDIRFEAKILEKTRFLRLCVQS
ncbi:hypothetical protein [Microcoleus sp. bin38.metabat.b11b12b14.051]|uniref:hypothetical protein n=1 Tax=Microcoleus sp. bin38.metabat.b11b12b14.051 TaxID=2742709 RepID=UPI0025CEFB57|nr:hypothetical protein [Microcoleus sp. bin38.metabat.b11b12b14.051]